MPSQLVLPPSCPAGRLGRKDTEQPGARLRSALGLLAALLIMIALGGAAQATVELPRFIDGIDPAAVFPGADRLGATAADPPVAPAYRQGEQIGFVFLTSDSFLWLLRPSEPDLTS